MLRGVSKEVADRLTEADHRVYVVGGAVRDWLLGKEPHDIDLATTALPEQVLTLFPESKGDGAEFGRVLVGDVDVLTLREDGEYKDARRPSRVAYTTDITKDLARRDFTINAMAFSYPSGMLLDPFNGAVDLRCGIVRAVGNPSERFEEDALRIMRGLRFLSTLGFRPADGLVEAANACAPRLVRISPERIRDELSQLLVGPSAGRAIQDMLAWGAMAQVLPEVQAGNGCKQNCPNHWADVWGHTVEVFWRVRPELHMRLAALLHDVGKPVTKQTREDGRDTFYNHDHVGANMAEAILNRLRYPTAITERVVRLVANHMFHFDDRTTPGAVRRLIARVGPENVDDLLELRLADHLGSRSSQYPQGRSYNMLRQVAEEMRTEHHAITVKDLAINGYDVMYMWHLPPGKLVGIILDCCLNYVLDDPERNTREDLIAFIDEQMHQEGECALWSGTC